MRCQARQYLVLSLTTALLFLASLPVPCTSSSSTFSLSSLHGAIHENRGIHIPLYRSETTTLAKRDPHRAEIGLGDDLDITYKVMVNVGSTQTPLVLDTGSSDLWLVSDACTPNCAPSGFPLYSQSSLNSTGLQVRLLYGDSHTGTHAFGPIGTDTAGLAGLSVPGQCFAAIVDTNTTVLKAGTVGILGLGFPPISVIWRELLQSQLYQPSSSPSVARSNSHNKNKTSHHDSFDPMKPRNLVAGLRSFPSFEFLSHPRENKRRQENSPLPVTPASASAAINSFGSYGPLVTRLISQGQLDSPFIAITLQRDTFSVGGNAGLLSLGALPGNTKTDDMTWMPVRAYSVDEGGLPAPPDAPNEVYPLVWEIPIEDVFFDNVKLPRSTLSAPSISLSGVLDTGNSLIRGPKDVISPILSHFSSPDNSFECDEPHNLSFQIGGKLFPVDPRDFARPISGSSGHSTSSTNVSARCMPALAVTDPPGQGGFLYSWSLGDPFLKSVLAAYYYGNLTHPSQDPPRVGLLSTVPSNADDELSEAVKAAEGAGGVFPATSEAAPSGTYAATVTGFRGVPKAAPSSSTTSSAASVRVRANTWTSLFGAGAVTAILMLLGM